MSWLSKFTFGKKNQPVEKKSYAVNLGQVTGNSLLEFVTGGIARVTPSQAMQLYRQSSAVSTAVDRIADEMQYIMPVLYDRKANKVIEKSPVLDLLSNPNGWDHANIFIGDIARHHLLTHDSCVYAAGSVNRPPIELYAVKPQHLSPDSSVSGDYPKTLYVSDGNGQGNYTASRLRGKGFRYYDGSLKELYRIRGFSSRSDNAFSDSPLEAIRLEAMQQIQGKHHNLALLNNGGRLSLVAIFKDDTPPDQEQADARRQVINEQIAGARNAGKIGVVSASEVEFKEFGVNNKDMDYANLDEMARQAVYLRYKVPLPLVSMDASTFNNMEQAVYHLYDSAVIPNYTYIMTALSYFLLPRFGLDVSDFFITYNPESIPAIQGRRIEELKARKDLGVETINEIRAGLPNRSPIEGGDTLYQPATLVPVGTDLVTIDNGYTAEEEARRLMERDGQEG